MVTFLALLSLQFANGDMVPTEFNSLPAAEGWTPSNSIGELTTWVENGSYFQDFMHNCPHSNVCGTEAFTRSVQEFNKRSAWFYEYRLSATGPRTDIPGGGPTVLAAANSFGVGYNASVSRDQVKFFRDVHVPVLFFDLEPDVPHTIRLELENTPPATYVWYIDGVLVDVGLAVGPFPVRDSRITWQGRSWHAPTFNQWDYIRFGDIPADASGDFDSNEAVELFDYYYFHECLTNERIGINGGPGNDSGPGCRWADFDADADVDLLDLAAFQNLFEPGH